MTDIKFSLIDLGDLSQPAKKLIATVSKAIGVLYEPARIRRKAEADADAAIILAEGQVEVAEIAYRARDRIVYREIRRQENIESITEKAVTALPDEVSDKPVKEDWIFAFFEQCQDVSDEEMQRIWARILAEEVTKPGKYFRHTLAVVGTLAREDAELFQEFCTFAWVINNEETDPVVFDTRNENIRRHLHFGEILHLESLGLITFDLNGYTLITETRSNLARYHQRVYTLNLPKRLNKIPLGHALLTRVGHQLIGVSDPKPDYVYSDAVIEFWKAKGCTFEKAEADS